MLVLGIETSCDETAAAIVRDGTQVLSDVVVSQMELHREYGGVVPELASRKHVEAISMVLDEAFSRASISPEQIDGIGVTRGPGLIGSLLVGIAAAKGMALALGKPLVGVNHLHGHLFAVLLEHAAPAYPFIGLVVSGGHTSLYQIRGPLDIRVVGRTRDDAAGESFDKVAKLLGLGYPGGPIIESRAAGANSGGLRFPRALMDKDELDFSFSGLKTAALRQVEDMFGVARDRTRFGSFHKLIGEDQAISRADEIRSIATAFQEAVVEALVVKSFRAARMYGSDKLIVCGGVAANRALRAALTEEGQRIGIEPLFPSIRLCTDNAAMIAARAEVLLAAGLADDLGFGALSRW